MKILTFISHYLPAFKAGDPIRTIANMVEHLGGDFQFRIVTGDRDFGARESLDEIDVDQWNQVGNAEVLYLSPGNRHLWRIGQILNSQNYDVLYLNSFFHPVFTGTPMLLRRLGLAPKKPAVVACRGEFSPGALALKSRKKSLYLHLVKGLGLYDDVLWQATSPQEASCVRNVWGDTDKIHVAPNLTPAQERNGSSRPPKVQGKAKIAFLGRISRVKNLDGALRMLQDVEGDVTFDLYGPVEDESYWRECKELIAQLASNINVTLRGPIPNEDVVPTLSGYHLFFLPTLGENYGHAIREALSAGCPVLISDQTPWRKLSEKMAGWDLPLSQPKKFQQVLSECIEMDEESYCAWTTGASKLGQQSLSSEPAVAKNRALFERAFRCTQPHI